MKITWKHSIISLLSLITFGCGGGGGTDIVAGPVTGNPTGQPSTPAPNPVPNPGTPPVLSPDGVVFFQSNASAGGDGSANSPFNDFATALASTPAGETLFLYAGSGPIPFNGTIPGNIRILGEGLGFTTTGFSVTAGAFPRLQGQITLADGAVVQGVQFENPTGHGATAANVTSLTLDSNRFTNISGDALHIERANGTLRLTNNAIVDDSLDPTDGVDVTVAGSDNLNLTFNSNTFSTPSRANSFDNGLKLTAQGSSQLTLNAQSNTFDVQGRGVQIQVSETSVFNGTLTQNTFTQTPLEGISLTTGLATTDTAQATIVVDNNTFNQPLGPGVSLLAGGATTNNWTVQNNTVNAGGNFGLLLVRGDSAFARSSVSNNQISNAQQVGFQYTSGTASGGFTVPLAGEDRITVSGNQVTGSGVSSMNLNLVSQTHAALLTDNTTGGPVVMLARATNACAGAGSNNIGGAFTINVENGFSLIFDNRGQTTPAVSFPGAGTVTAGVCNP